MFCNGCFPWHSGNVSLNANQIFFISKPLCPELPSLMCHIIVKLSLKRSTFFFAISYVNMEPCLLQENHRLPFLTILFYLYGFGYKSLLRSIYCSDLQRADWNCLTGCEALALTFSSNHLEEILIGWQKNGLFQQTSTAQQAAPCLGMSLANAVYKEISPGHFQKHSP